MQIIVATEPDEIKDVSSLKYQIAYTAYKIGDGGRLYRAEEASEIKSGLMIVSMENTGFTLDETTLEEILSECKSRNFWGVIINFDASELPENTINEFKQNKLRLIVHEEFGNIYNEAWVMVSTSLSGGTLKRRLSEASELFGAERILLDVERISLDFVPPTPDGNGRTLTKEEFSDIMEKLSPTPYFSPDLCCYYFTYFENDKIHFILYDNLNSIKNKLAIAESLKINKAIFLYSETKNIINSL